MRKATTTIYTILMISLFISFQFPANLHAQTKGCVLLWNKLGSDQEVLNSMVGPDLHFYSHDRYENCFTETNRAYPSGVFGNAATIAPGPYQAGHTAVNFVLEDPNNLISPEQGTIEVWYKQIEYPVPWSHNLYELFDHRQCDSPTHGPRTGIYLYADGERPGGNPQPRLYFAISDGSETEINWAQVYSLEDGYRGYNMTVKNNIWIHIAAVWERSGIDGSSDTMRLYLDGNLVATSQQTGWLNKFGNLADIVGGNDAEIAGKFFIDNIIIWDSALTDFSHRFNENPLASNFSDFNLKHALINFKKLSDSDRYYIKGNFTLGENSDGIDPLEEVVKLKVGTSNLEIPAGSFLKIGKRKYKFIGKIGDVRVHMSIKTLKSNGFGFMAWIRGIDLTDTPNPVPIGLHIGDDMGQSDIWLSGILTLK